VKPRGLREVEAGQCAHIDDSRDVPRE
jgi:hypothetical protein